MDAVEFLNEKYRMMLEDTNAYMKIPRDLTNEQLVKHVENWSKAHKVPKASHERKTRLQDFLEKFPNTNLKIDGMPFTCVRSLGYQIDGECRNLSCVTCWNQPVEE